MQCPAIYTASLKIALHPIVHLPPNSYKTMFIFDHPYISDVAEKFLIESQAPLLRNEFSKNHISSSAHHISDDEAMELLERSNFRWLYSNSENAIAWINEKFGKNSKLSQKIDLFKDKFKFREATKALFPDITFLKISAEKIDALTFEEIGSPFIIKPVVGFISAGVYRVNNPDEWNVVQKKIHQSTQEAAQVFPDEVLNSNFYIIESIIEGDEYAIDAYFDEDNNPVVLNILHHQFSGAQDMSDRLYITSAEIIKKQLHPIQEFLKKISTLGDFRSLPVHTEIRIDSQGIIRPIEINPLRFAGWCSTDIAYYAYGLNVYEAFAKQEKPNWDKLLEGKEDDQFALGVIEKATPISDHQVFDYAKLENILSAVISMRKMDYRTFPLYAFVFFKVTPKTKEELHTVLTLNPDNFISTPS